MGETRPCSVCGKTTSRFLFNDRRLDIAICSRKCECEYLETCNSLDEIDVLRYLDNRIEKTRWHKKIGWMIASFGLLLVAVGYFISQVTVLVFGVLPMTLGALSTSHFEDKIDKLTRLRKRIAI